MRVLVIGCGYVGERVADLLRAAGHEVAGTTRSEDSARRLAAAKPYPVLDCDVADPAAVGHLAGRLPWPPDAVVHCASSSRGGADIYRGVYLQGVRNLAAEFPAARPVFCSSTSVYPQADGSSVSEDSDASPDRETGRILREAEDRVLAQGGVVARLAGIYGPGRSFVLRSFLEGAAAIEGNDGQGRWLNQIHREDAARALVHLVAGGHRGVFNVCDDTPLLQRACFEELARRFERPLPPVAPPHTGRKRAWTSKRVSNARLRATGWAPLFPSYFHALDGDAALVPSILAQLPPPTGAGGPRVNIILVGLMGSGKTTVGRIAAQILGFDFVDTDHLVAEAAGCTIPEIFASEGEAGFRRRETAALRSLLGRTRMVVATGGGIVTQPENLPLLRELGFVVWLSAAPEVLHRRTFHSNDRPLLREGDPLQKLRDLHQARAPLYEKASELRISTDDLSLRDAAYGLAESARVHFRAQS